MFTPESVLGIWLSRPSNAYPMPMESIFDYDLKRYGNGAKNLNCMTIDQSHFYKAGYVLKNEK
ncbi:hypothetical protein A3195_13505 [Candidatus Thiodiazotropha endoloripes]|uniref:Uncharacterized protein n=1 Tax=Candidatus Thiodiazotropha endoloripes TaxID=1818881 RepID=A0A1E2USI7_9GAMM|nr:hypothetical protein A3195_13505 [Candidatus Thiodiazotropha endoloripes]ODB88638.1 hypothetical protein A3193_07295 [Candidatus Thiodiazotropha endoloripes]ODB97727.1 hypothetical protein A3196_13735 [Candidatus Thiodiazotropha endoloripes]